MLEMVVIMLLSLNDNMRLVVMAIFHLK